MLSLFNHSACHDLKFPLVARKKEASSGENPLLERYIDHLIQLEKWYKINFTTLWLNNCPVFKDKKVVFLNTWHVQIFQDEVNKELLRSLSIPRTINLARRVFFALAAGSNVLGCETRAYEPFVATDEHDLLEGCHYFTSFCGDCNAFILQYLYELKDSSNKLSFKERIENHLISAFNAYFVDAVDRKIFTLKIGDETQILGGLKAATLTQWIVDKVVAYYENCDCLEEVYEKEKTSFLYKIFDTILPDQEELVSNDFIRILCQSDAMHCDARIEGLSPLIHLKHPGMNSRKKTVFLSLVRATTLKMMLLLNQALVAPLTVDLFQRIVAQVEKKKNLEIPSLIASHVTITFGKDLSLSHIMSEFKLFLPGSLIKDPLQKYFLGSRERSVLGVIRSEQTFSMLNGQLGVKTQSSPLTNAWFYPETPKKYMDLMISVKRGVQGVSNKKYQILQRGVNNTDFFVLGEEMDKDWLLIHKI